MPKLHEVLAVEGQLKEQAKTTRGELRDTFAKKRHLFEEKRQTFQSKEEGAEPVTEQHSEIHTTVRKELKWIAGIWSKALDASLQVAEGNTQAFADVVLDDGSVLLEHVPATALLELEKRAGEIADLLKAIPTLDPAKGFRPDADRGDGIFKARERNENRTKKVQVPVTLYQATVEHPAQTQLVPEDVVTGKITVQEWSGMITPGQKADLIDRAEALQRAFKRARSRANDVEVGKPKNIGSKLFDYVFGT